MAVEAEDAFEKELVELFIQEAHEWLQQIHVALDELQQGPLPDRHLKLAQTIKAGLTNLGGSAATINLNDVERASFSALPFVEAVQHPAATISVNDFIALCKQLGHIHTALTRATGVAFDAEGAEASVEALPVTVPSSELLAALSALQQRQSVVGGVHRHLVHIVIAQVHGLMQNGVAQCDATSMRDFLGRLAEAEDAFYEVLQQQLPRVIEGVASLKVHGQDSARAPERLQALLDQVAQLVSAAQQVNASPAMTFFMGLQSFLTVALQRRVVIAVQRYEAVESGVRTISDTIQAWLEAGRAERSAIGSLLPS
jgi:Holliday junction resolvasome RuvABC endonuclease subunit